MPSSAKLPLTGHPAPDFTLTDTSGNQVSLSQFTGKKAVVLVFNRGFA
jgi:peroxiredoxin